MRTFDTEGSVNGGNFANFICAVLVDERVFCWGANGDGQSGVAASNVASLSQVVGLPTDQGKIVQIKVQSTLLAPPFGGTCVLFESGQIYCWGLETIYTTLAEPRHVPRAQKVFAGAAVSRLGGMANDVAVLLKDKTLVSVNAASPINGIKDVNAFSQDGRLLCYLSVDQKLRCMGIGTYGILGDGVDSDQVSAAREVTGILGIVKGVSTNTRTTSRTLFAGNDPIPLPHVCAITIDDRVFCWGGDDYGQSTGSGILNNNKIFTAPKEIVFPK